MKLPATRVRRFATITAGGAFVLFLAAQCIRPAIPVSSAGVELQAPAEVKEILGNSCYNCHSNQPRLSWFDQVAPAYWLVARDVREARRHLNFSEMGRLPAAQQQGLLFEAVNQIQLGAMPLPSYLAAHPQARLTGAQVTVLRKYLVSLSAPGANPPATTQYEDWIGAAGKSLHVSAAPNGIAFLPDYKNWKAVSSTERFDNHTLRLILGNDVTVRAIASGHIRPWPDGSAFAKIAWNQERSSDGRIRSGDFIQVEFMIRDHSKYASTAGWGWARWRGVDLKPYGRDASFTKECVSCHRPVRTNDYVYTMPIGGQQ